MPEAIKMYPTMTEALFLYPEEIRFMNMESEKPSHTFKIAASMISFNSLAGHCALASREKDAWSFYDLEAQKKVVDVEKSLLCRTRTDRSIDQQISSLNFHPDGLILSTGHTNGTICLWDIRSCKMIKELNAFQSPGKAIKSFSFSNRGYMFACAPQESMSIKLFDMRKQFEETSITIAP